MNECSEKVWAMVQMAAQRIIDHDCRRDCRHYHDGDTPIACPHLYPRDNGVICCYGWEPCDESATESTA